MDITEQKSLYEITGRITDINTVLINRKDFNEILVLLELLKSQLNKETE